MTYCSKWKLLDSNPEAPSHRRAHRKHPFATQITPTYGTNTANLTPSVSPCVCVCVCLPPFSDFPRFPHSPRFPWPASMSMPTCQSFYENVKVSNSLELRWEWTPFYRFQFSISHCWAFSAFHGCHFVSRAVEKFPPRFLLFLTCFSLFFRPVCLFFNIFFFFVSLRRRSAETTPPESHSTRVCPTTEKSTQFTEWALPKIPSVSLDRLEWVTFERQGVSA